MKKILAISNIIAGVMGIWCAAGFILMWFYMGGNGDSTRVIGGSDGPTVIFIASEPHVSGIIILAFLCLLPFINAFAFFRLYKNVTKPKEEEKK